MPSHLRSRLFNPRLSVNPMVLAAQPLLSLLRRIQQCPVGQMNNETLQALSHEMRVFHQRILQQHYDLNNVEIATTLMSRVAVTVVSAKQLSPLPQLVCIDNDHKQLATTTPDLPTLDDCLAELNSYPEIYSDAVELAYLCLTAIDPRATQHSTQTNNWSSKARLTALFESIQGNRDSLPLPTPSRHSTKSPSTAMTHHHAWRTRLLILGGMALTMLLISEWWIDQHLGSLLTVSSLMTTE